ncbi:MAG: hypothetical protein LBU09_04795 [Endomicrobium sp.]|jgi:hypothetical protein|nr:hypothetical protein [Endomicrobium sp.]
MQSVKDISEKNSGTAAPAVSPYIYYIHIGRTYPCIDSLKAHGAKWYPVKKIWFFEKYDDEIKRYCKIMRFKVKKIRFNELERYICQTCDNRVELATRSECAITKQIITDFNDGCGRYL